MGGGKFDHSAYASFTSSTRGKSTEEIYASKSVNSDLDPKGVKIRESRDSDDNPHSTPLIIALDVTGSMSIIADNIAREGLGTLFTGIFDRKPIEDPHIMFMAIGDAFYDRSPLQVSQFEADKRIIEQLTQIYLEHGGGGNNFESYNLAWYFAAMHTVHDSMEKRGKRGYLFTVGDEEAPEDLSPEQIKDICGDVTQPKALTSRALLQLAQRTYDVFHVVILEGSHARTYKDRVVSSWTKILGQHVIQLADYTKLAETIIAAIEVAEGADAASAAKGWGTGSAVIHEAVKHLPRGSSPKLIGKR